MARFWNTATKRYNPSADTGSSVYQAAEWVQVNEPDPAIYDSVARRALVDPRYWKLVGSDLVEMDPAEKASADAADLQAGRIAAGSAVVAFWCIKYPGKVVNLLQAAANAGVTEAQEAIDRLTEILAGATIEELRDIVAQYQGSGL